MDEWRRTVVVSQGHYFTLSFTITLDTSSTCVATTKCGDYNKSQPTHIVIVGILWGGQHEHPDQGQGCGDWCQRRNGRYELQQQEAQEIEIGQPLKLLQQV